MYNFGANPYGTGTPPVQNTPPGTLALTPAAPSVTSAIGAYARNVHGFVSAGVSSRGGEDLAAGVEMPLVPGKLDLAVSGNTGQTGGWAHPAGTKAPDLRYNGYQASLDYHPTDDFEAEIGVSGENLRFPYSYAR